MCGIFENADTFIGNVEEDDCCTKDTARADDMKVKDAANAYEQENQNLSTDTFEANLAGKGVIADSAHDAGDVVDDHKGNECVEQAVPASEEVAEPATNAGEDKLN